MQANELSLRKENEGQPNEQWYFDGVGNCGEMFFENVITIVEPLSKCPGLCIPNRLGIHGIWGVENAINMFKAERANLGLSVER